MKINICIFLLMLIATLVCACGPQEHLAGAPVTSIPMAAPVLLVTRTPRPPSTIAVTTASTLAPAPAPIMVVQAPAAQAAPVAMAAAPAAPPAMAAAPAAQAAGGAAAPAAGGAAPQAPGGAAAQAAGRAAAPVAAQQPGLGRKKRSVDLSKMKKCRSAEFDVIMDQKDISQETSEIVKKLKLKVESVRKIFSNKMNRIEIKSIRGERLKITHKVDVECNSVRHAMLDALVEMETIQSIVIKCECQPSIVLFKKDFKVW